MKPNLNVVEIVAEADTTLSYADQVLRAAEAAHQAEVAADSAPVHPDIARIAAEDESADALAAEREAATALETGLAQAAQDAARKEQERAADAMRVVLREKARHGHDLTAMRPHEAQAAKIIEGALGAVSAGFPPKQEDAFNTTSSDADIAKGASVGAVLVGGGQ